MNIEEIKKEIKNTFYIDENNMHFEVAKINIDTLFKILDKYKDKEDKLREYITSYESISIIQGLNDIIKNKDLDEKTMIEMTNRYLEVHNKLLQILNEVCEK
jgi:hypothetical protein